MLAKEFVASKAKCIHIISAMLSWPKVKAWVFYRVQHPGSYWDRSSVWSLVAVEPTKRLLFVITLQTCLPTTPPLSAGNQCLIWTYYF